MGRGSSDEDELPLPLALPPLPPQRIFDQGITINRERIWSRRQGVVIHAAFAPQQVIHGTSMVEAELVVYPTPFGTGLSFSSGRSDGADNWPSWCTPKRELCLDTPCVHAPVLKLAQQLWDDRLGSPLDDMAALWETRRLDAHRLEFVSPATSFQVMRLTDGVYASAVHIPRHGAESGPHEELAHACVGDAYHCVRHPRYGVRATAFTCPLRFALSNDTPLSVLEPRLASIPSGPPDFGFSAQEHIRLEVGTPGPSLTLRVDNAFITLQDPQGCRICTANTLFQPTSRLENHLPLHQLFTQLAAAR